MKLTIEIEQTNHPPTEELIALRKSQEEPFDAPFDAPCVSLKTRISVDGKMIGLIRDLHLDVGADHYFPRLTIVLPPDDLEGLSEGAQSKLREYREALAQFPWVRIDRWVPKTSSLETSPQPLE